MIPDSEYWVGVLIPVIPSFQKKGASSRTYPPMSSSGPPARTALYAPGGEAGDDPHCVIGRRGFMSGPFSSGFGGGWAFRHRGRR